MLTATVGNAAVVTINFTGTVTSTDANAVAISEVQVGDEVTGQYRFAAADPEAWKIINGKLYLTGSKVGIKWFSEHAAEAIKQADENWHNLLDQR